MSSKNRKSIENFTKEDIPSLIDLAEQSSRPRLRLPARKKAAELDLKIRDLIKQALSLQAKLTKIQARCPHKNEGPTRCEDCQKPKTFPIN